MVIIFLIPKFTKSYKIILNLETITTEKYYVFEVWVKTDHSQIIAK